MGNSVTLFRDELELVIVGALVFVASLAWRDWFAQVEDRVVPKADGLFGRFLFVLLETLVIFWLIFWVRRVLQSEASKSRPRWLFDSTQAGGGALGSVPNAD